MCVWWFKLASKAAQCLHEKGCCCWHFKSLPGQDGLESQMSCSGLHLALTFIKSQSRLMRSWDTSLVFSGDIVLWPDDWCWIPINHVTRTAICSPWRPQLPRANQCHLDEALKHRTCKKKEQPREFRKTTYGQRRRLPSSSSTLHSWAHPLSHRCLLHKYSLLADSLRHLYCLATV